MRFSHFSGVLALVMGVVSSSSLLANVPGSIEITCDVGRANFRSVAVGQSDVKFKLWSAATGGTQIGSDYTVPMTDLVVFKRYTEKYDSVSKRKAARINAVIGSDAFPVLLPVDGMAFLDVTVGATTLGCDFAATGSLTTRRRLQAAPFAQPSDISVRVFNSADISIPNDVETTLTFDSERWDTENLHDTTVNTDRLTATTAGKYYVFGHVLFEANAAGGERSLRIYRNGTANALGQLAVPPVTHAARATGLSISTHVNLAAGDFVLLRVLQDSGAPLNISHSASTSESAEFGMVKLP